MRKRSGFSAANAKAGKARVKFEVLTGTRARISRRSRSTFRLVKLIVALGILIKLESCKAQILGKPAKCNNEGQRVDPPIDNLHPCFACICERGIVQCRRQECPKCFVRLNKSTPCCAYSCKGCSLNGIQLPASNYWNKTSQCGIQQCNNGIVTQASKHCYVPCQRPLPPPSGECCPTCPDCARSDVMHGVAFMHPEKRCTECVCSRDGMRCWKKVCPVLSCSGDNIKPGDDGCCQQCSGTRLVFDLEQGQCWFRRHILRHNEVMRVDECTSCKCQNGTVLCQPPTCPNIQMCLGHEVWPQGGCCPLCPQNMFRNCSMPNGRTKQHRDEWSPAKNPCSRCKCNNGTITCTNVNCPTTMPQCPNGQVLDYKAGKCCRTCIQEPGICAVFGDPHYRTFDGRPFNFQGSCKYLLTKDCLKKRFSVTVENDAKRSLAFSWTRNVYLKAGGLSISLHQRLVAKMKGRKVALPYYNKDVLIVLERGFIKVRTKLGISLNWDGDSYLEAGASPKYGGVLCGLCGNFNGFARDDFIGGDGFFKFDKNDFASSWRTEGNCSRRDYNIAPEPCGKTLSSQLQSRKKCSLFKSAPFRPCYPLVDPQEYYKSCLTDSCECPRHKSCSCESIRAYTSACARRGVTITWKEKDYCKKSCRKGKVYSACGPPCRFNCRNYKNHKRVRRCQKRPCVAGCHCPAGYVIKKSRCVKPTSCKRRKKTI